MIFTIRPEPGLQSTLAAARELGLAIIGRPLFDVVPLYWETPKAEEFDGLLIGSANAIRHGGEGLEKLQGLPVYAVGEKTAEAAREARFRVKETGTGGLQNLLTKLTPPLRLLRLAGAEHVALAPPDRITITSRIVYEVRAVPLTGSDEVSLRASQPLVLLHSAAAAEHFAAEIERREIEKGQIALACIGPRVAEAAGDGWRDVQSAPQPDDSSLLALAKDMWH